MKTIAYILMFSYVLIFNEKIGLAQATKSPPNFKLSSFSINDNWATYASGNNYSVIVDNTKYSKELRSKDSSFTQLNTSKPTSILNIGFLIGVHPYIKSSEEYCLRKEWMIGLNYGVDETTCSLTKRREIYIPAQLMDSTINTNIIYSQVIRRVGLDLRFITSIPINKQLTIYYGSGWALSHSITGRVSRYGHTFSSSGNNFAFYNTFEIYKPSNYAGIVAYLPVGFSFQLSENLSVLKNIQLTGELRLTENFTCRYSKTFASFNLYTNVNAQIGIKYNLYNKG